MKQLLREVHNASNDVNPNDTVINENNMEEYSPTIAPVPIPLTEQQTKSISTPINRWNKSTIHAHHDAGYLVPFLDNLQQLLSIECVADSVLKSFVNYAKEPRPMISDISDGIVFGNNPIFIEQKGKVLSFQLYSDEVEVAYPLGSKKSKHEVTIFYWTLLNLPQWRSKLRSI